VVGRPFLQQVSALVVFIDSSCSFQIFDGALSTFSALLKQVSVHQDFLRPEKKLHHFIPSDVSSTYLVR
jgi:hypothetical protein